MRLKSTSILVGVLMIACAVFGQQGRESRTSNGIEVNRPKAAITVTLRGSPTWSLSDTKSRLYLTVKTSSASEIRALPSLHLRSVSNSDEEFWAPFEISSGAPSAKEQAIVTEDAKVRTLELDPSNLRWARAISSVWPNGNLVETVPEGKYLVWVQLETQDHSIISSKKMRIKISK